jgi:hypothetical protein
MRPYATSVRGHIADIFFLKSRQVPLNGLTPESLGMILRVQGISDMSIERLLEQTVQVLLQASYTRSLRPHILGA